MKTEKLDEISLAHTRDNLKTARRGRCETTKKAGRSGTCL